MPADDVARALMAMDDERLRSAVATGDLSGLADLDLSDEERALVEGAAAEGDVEGFSFGGAKPTGLLCNGRAGLLCDGRAGMQCNEHGGGFGGAISYANQGLSTGLSLSFGQWAAAKNAQGGW